MLSCKTQPPGHEEAKQPQGRPQVPVPVTLPTNVLADDQHRLPNVREKSLQIILALQLTLCGVETSCPTKQLLITDLWENKSGLCRKPLGFGWSIIQQQITGTCKLVQPNSATHLMLPSHFNIRPERRQTYFKFKNKIPKKQKPKLCWHTWGLRQVSREA